MKPEYQLERVQRGIDPDDWKPMQSARQGRPGNSRSGMLQGRIGSSTSRRIEDAIYVLHAFAKKTQRTPEARPDARGGTPQTVGKDDAFMKKQRFDSVWDALETSPAAAANMKARAELMIALRETIDGWHVSQAAAATEMG